MDRQLNSWRSLPSRGRVITSLARKFHMYSSKLALILSLRSYLYGGVRNLLSSSIVAVTNNFFLDVQPVQRQVIYYSTLRVIPMLIADLLLVLFKKYGITVKFIKDDSPEAFAAAIDENTKAIYVESIGNPKYNVAPLPELAKVRYSYNKLRSR